MPALALVPINNVTTLLMQVKTLAKSMTETTTSPITPWTLDDIRPRGIVLTEWILMTANATLSDLHPHIRGAIADQPQPQGN